MRAITAVIHRGENVKWDSWRQEYDGTVGAKLAIAYAEDLALCEDLISRFLHEAQRYLDEFIDDTVEKEAYEPEIEILLDGRPVMCIDTSGEPLEDRLLSLQWELDKYVVEGVKAEKLKKAKKANDERLAREREEKAKKDARELAEYARLQAKFGKN